MARLALCDVRGLLVDSLEKLSGEDGDVWVEAFKKTLRKENPWAPSEKLLRRLKATTVSGAKKFVAKDHLKSANVGWTNSEFDRLFKEKVEENVPDTAIVAHRLERESLDAPILTELGYHAETRLAYLFALLEKQSKGEEGLLLTNGYANIVYVRDANGILWAVFAYWPSGYGHWRVGAYSVVDPRRWDAGSQVLSRDS